MKKKSMAIITIALVFLCLFVSCEEEIKSYTVSFDSNGGYNIPSVIVLKGESVTKPEDPSMEGMEFCGWYLNDTLYDFTLPVTSNITLVAKWEHVKHVFNENDICSICNGVRCGEDVVFIYDKDSKTLFLDGRGSTYDYLDDEWNFMDRPWEACLEEMIKVVVGEGITKIGDATFVLIDESEGFISTSINEILLPTSLKEIGSYSFAGTSIEKIIIPEGTIKLGHGALALCESLTDITIPASIEEIGYDVFDDSGITRVTYLGTEEEWIKIDWKIDGTDYDVYLQNEDRNLIFNFYYNKGVLTAQYLTKYGKELDELVVPEYFIGINSSTFKNSKATVIYIPDSVITIEKDTFINAPELKKLYVDKTKAEFNTMYPYEIRESITVYFEDAT